MNTSRHLFFLLSPFVIIGIVITFISIGYDRSAEIAIIVLEGYFVLFFIVSSFLVFRFRKSKFESDWNRFLIRNGYPIGSTILFAWLFLLPIMKAIVGMWDSTLLNFIVTFALSTFGFYFLIGIYSMASNIVRNKNSYLDKT